MADAIPGPDLSAGIPNRGPNTSQPAGESFDLDALDPLNPETRKPSKPQKNEETDDGLEAAAEDDTAEDADDTADEDEGGEGEEGGDGEETDDGLADVEYEGKSYKVPPELKDALMRNADYTQGKQQLAADRRATALEKQRLESLASITVDEMRSYSALQATEASLGQYANVDWARLAAENPALYDVHWRNRQTLEREAQVARQRLAEMQRQRTAHVAEMDRARLAATAEFAKRTIPNWSPELDSKLIAFAADRGIDRETLIKAYSPEVYDLLHLAYIGLNLQKAQSSAKPKPKPKAEEPKPTVKVTGRNAKAGRKSYQQMSTAEFVEIRNKREAAQRGRGIRH